MYTGFINNNYSSDNNLTHVDLTNGSDLDFAYDAAGRRLEKKLTTVSGSTTTATRYRYHYIGSQITTIDIYQTQTTGETTTVTKDDQMRIHLGANTRPISFEYYTKNLGNEQVTSATYYYHYDLHGNVIRVTDSSGTTQITYTYDQLGTITSTTNANSIYNPFTYMGEAQIIQDSEFDTSGATPKTGLYNSGSGYYNPETGTSLGGSGAPASSNPVSGSMEEPSAQSTRPSSQLGGGTTIATVAGGMPSSDTPASCGDVVPEVPYEGLIKPAVVSQPPQDTTQCLDPAKCIGLDEPGYDDGSPYTQITDQHRRMFKKADMPENAGKSKEEDSEWLVKPVIDEEGNVIVAGVKKQDWLVLHNNVVIPAYICLPSSVQTQIRDDWRRNHSSDAGISDADLDKLLTQTLLWAAWTNEPEDIKDPDGSSGWVTKAGDYLLGYQVLNSGPRFFWGPGEPTNQYAKGQVGAPFDSSTIGDGANQMASAMLKSHSTDEMQKAGCTFNSVSNVGGVEVVLFGYDTQYNGNTTKSPGWESMMITISNGFSGNVSYLQSMVEATRQYGKLKWITEDSDNENIGHYEADDANLDSLRLSGVKGMGNFSGFPSYIVNYLNGDGIFAYHDTGHFRFDLRSTQNLQGIYRKFFRHEQ